MKSIQSFKSDQRGTVVMIFAGITVLLAAVAGGAVDLARAYAVKSKLSAAADMAVMAAATTSSSDRVAIAKAHFANGFPGGVVPQVTVSGSSVTVAAASPVKTLLLHVIGMKEIAVGASSGAQIGSASTAPICILLLEPSKDSALYVNSAARLDANCGVHVNSSDNKAIYVNSHSHVVAAAVNVKGKAHTNSGSTISPAAKVGVAPMADPLATLPIPVEATAGCNHTDFKVNSGESKVMHPGVYCKKTVINSHSTATMMPGVYVFRQGEFEINAHSAVTGAGVTMYFHDKDARLNVNSHSTLQASASTSGTYAGMLIFQNRAIADNATPPFIVNSGSTTKLEGTIYTPKATFEVNASNSIANVSAAYTVIVAQKLSLNNAGPMTVRSDFTSAVPLPALLDGFKNKTVARLTN